MKSLKLVNQHQVRRCAAVLSHSLAIALACVVTASPVSAQYAPVTPPPEALRPGFETITVEQAKEWLEILAGPKFEGRGTGQVGYSKAAHWVAGKVAEFGLEPVGDNGTYFQMLPMKQRVPLIDECQISGPDGLTITGPGNLGFERYPEQQEAVGEVVFVNFAGTDTTLPEGTNLRDKIVIYVSDSEAERRAPTQLARQRVMAAIRVIDTEPNSISQLIRPGGRRRSASVSGTITRAAAKTLVTGLSGNEKWLTAPAEPAVTVHPTGKEVNLRLRFREEPAAVPNVVAWLEGSDPELKDEYIVIGSHLDHLGISGGQVYPGADDNGSGSTAVLSIARAFASNPVRPKRSVLFIWFAAEEIGLVGSKHYCDNPTKPLDKMTCMFNIDMVGRNEEKGDETAEENEGAIHLVGSQRRKTKIHDLILQANEHVGFRFELDEEGVWNRSDQVNFYNKGVPVAFLFGGFHPDYHRPSDQTSAINFPKIAAAARLYYVAINLASDHGRFEMQPEEGE